jgi:hypothetical protein
MPAKTSSIKKPSAGRIVARELDLLKKKVKELTLRLEREAKARKLEAQLAAEAKKAREQLSKEMTAVREHDASSLHSSRRRWPMRASGSGHAKWRGPKSRN